MIMVGDTFHNFVDGVIIAAAFLTDIQLGIVTSMAIIAHEIPQEVATLPSCCIPAIARSRRSS